jgi:hypothetical protein
MLTPFFAEISSILMDLFGIVTTNKSLLMKWEIKAKQNEICLVNKTIKFLVGCLKQKWGGVKRVLKTKNRLLIRAKVAN